MVRGIAVIVTMGVLGGAIARVHTQSPPAAARTFDAASIRPNTSGDVNRRIEMPSPGTLVATNITLRLLITDAYRNPAGRLRRDYEITGGPGWIDSDGFDIVAKAAGPSEPPQMRAMIQALLEERFQLKVHAETRDVPIYALVLARADRKTGPQLQPSTGECQPFGGRGAPAPPTAVVGPAARTCGFAGRGGPGRMNGVAVTMAQLATTLSGQTQREVVERTGLTGAYDLTLTFLPERRLPELPAGAPFAPPADAPSIFTALQEQLGLKLEPQRGPMEVLVIDRAEKPSEN